MNLNKKIGFLLDNGFTPNFVSTLNESKINLLFEKMSKKETKEAQDITTKIKRFSASEVADAKTKGESLPGGKAVKMNPDGSVDVTMEGKEIGEDDTINVVNDPDATADGMGMFETELSEKFESKAQQGLFWARCNKCKSDDCKWCKMAKEFSKSTSKKQYKNMPEKKHPEKNVKYKKKETKESYLDMVKSGVLGGYRENLGKVSPSLKFEAALKEHVENIIIKDLEPAMKKKDLMKLIEGELRKRKSLKESFYYDDINEDSDTTSIPKRPDYTEIGVPSRPDRTENPNWDEDSDTTSIPKRPDYTEIGVPSRPDRTENPNWDEDSDEDDDTPRPRSRRMNDPFAPTIEPIIKPKIKPREPEREPEWEPDFDEPIVPNPDVNPEPQAKRKMKFRMNDPFAPTIEPDIKPKIKPREPEREPEWEPDFDEPIIPNPDVNPEPQAHKRKVMNKFKDEFYEAMKRMDEAYHKPLKYLK